MVLVIERLESILALKINRLCNNLNTQNNTLNA